MTYLQGKEQSDLFNTHTIWVARLLAQDRTTVCVSEVARSKEKEKVKRNSFQMSLYLRTHASLS